MQILRIDTSIDVKTGLTFVVVAIGQFQALSKQQHERFFLGVRRIPLAILEEGCKFVREGRLEPQHKIATLDRNKLNGRTFSAGR